MTLPSPKQLLARYGLEPKHSFGQNFLGDPALTGRIAQLASEPGPASVLEIGAGLGALTDELLSRVPRVVAIERDRDLLPALSDIFTEARESGRLELVEADAKSADWLALLGDAGPRVLAGNLPYQITGPLLEKTTALCPYIARAVYLVQKEVADRLAAPHGSESYGALSVFAQAAFSVRRAFVIKGGAFYPPPRVDSAVVVLDSRADRVLETPAFRKVVKSAFAGRRKTLRNAWKALAPADDLAAAAGDAGILLERRGETLSVAEFARMTAALQTRTTALDEPRDGSGEEA